MKNLIIKYFGLLLLGLAACTSVKVLNTKAADDFKLSDYHTFDFYEVRTSGDTLGEAFEERVELLKNEIARELSEIGLSRSSSNPDLKVNLGIVVEEKVQTRQTHIREAPIYIGQRRYSWKSEEVEAGRYREGTVSVDMVDPEQNELVWQGVAEGVIPRSNRKLKRTIQEGVEELFSQIPGADESM